MARLDNWIEPIKDDVAFDFGYINYENYKKMLRDKDLNARHDFDSIINEITLQYARGVEKQYIDGSNVSWMEMDERMLWKR